MASKSSWMKSVERKAYARLRRLRAKGLWDGTGRVPVDHVLEHLLGLRISWETVEEPPDSQVFACIRPETREVVLNEEHVELLREKRGFLRFCKGHEAGHADVFALLDESEQLKAVADSQYHPMRCRATKGEVSVIQSRLRDLPRELRTEVMREIKERERRRRSQGEDSDLERRSVDHYAAVLLMPADLVRSEMEGRDPSSWPELYDAAQVLGVSISAFTIRLRELGMIADIVDGEIVLDDGHAGQPNLF